MQKAGSLSASFVQFPPHAVIARYAPAPSGGVQVVGVSGQVLGSSFGAIRSRFSFVSSVAGAGCWVVLAPRSASLASDQPSLF